MARLARSVPTTRSSITAGSPSTYGATNATNRAWASTKWLSLCHSVSSPSKATTSIPLPLIVLAPLASVTHSHYGPHDGRTRRFHPPGDRRVRAGPRLRRRPGRRRRLGGGGDVVAHPVRQQPHPPERDRGPRVDVAHGGRRRPGGSRPVHAHRSGQPGGTRRAGAGGGRTPAARSRLRRLRTRGRRAIRRPLGRRHRQGDTRPAGGRRGGVRRRGGGPGGRRLLLDRGGHAGAAVDYRAAGGGPGDDGPA